MWQWDAHLESPEGGWLEKLLVRVESASNKDGTVDENWAEGTQLAVFLQWVFSLQGVKLWEPLAMVMVF